MMEKFTWKVEKFSRLTTKIVYTEPFVLCGYPWKLKLFPNGNKIDDHISIYLVAKKTNNMSKGWNRNVKFKVILFNQLDTNKTVSSKEIKVELDASKDDSGFKTFMNLSELHDPQNGFLVKDTCILGVEVLVCKSTNEKQVNQIGSHIGPRTFEVSRAKSEGGVPNSETLSPVSSLVCNEPTKDPNEELQYASLWRVICFLKTNKVKDMNEEACKQLQVLWDVVVKFKFDLSWLEPHVEYALGMKSFVERAMQVEKLKEDVGVMELETERLKEYMVVLELETERLKTKLDSAEIKLDLERDLLKEKGLKEIELDSELGCGSWIP